MTESSSWRLVTLDFTLSRDKCVMCYLAGNIIEAIFRLLGQAGLSATLRFSDAVSIIWSIEIVPQGYFFLTIKYVLLLMIF